MTGHASPIQATYFNHTMTMDNNTSDNRRDPDSRQEPENYRNPEGSTPKAHSPTHPSFETLAIHADRTLSPREPGARWYIRLSAVPCSGWRRRSRKTS